MLCFLSTVEAERTAGTTVAARWSSAACHSSLEDGRIRDLERGVRLEEKGGSSEGSSDVGREEGCEGSRAECHESMHSYM